MATNFNDYRVWGRYFAAPIRKGWDAFIDLLQSATGQAIKAPYKFKVATSMSNPGQGYLKVNNLDPTLVTQMAINETDSNGDSNALMMSALRENDILQIAADIDRHNYVFQATAEAVDNGGWYTVNLAYVSNTGGFVDEEDVVISMIVYSANAFLELTDTPESYSGFAAYTVAVNAAETGLEYKDLAPSIFTYAYRWRDSITPPPLAGQVKSNNLDPSLATELYVSTVDDNGINRELALSYVREGDGLGFIDSLADKAYSYQLTGAPVPDVMPNPTYYTYPVVNLGIRGVFADNQRGFIGITLVGAKNFTELQDAPASYVGEAGKVVQVKATEDGLEFVTGGGGGVTVFTGLTDTPASYVDQTNRIVAVNATANGLSFEGTRIVKEGIFAVERSAFPVIYLREVANQTTDAGLISFSGTIMTIGPKKPTGQALLRFDPQPSDGVSNALFQFFRTTATTGQRIVYFFAGDGSGTFTHQFNCAVGGAVNLCNQGGIVYMGPASGRLQVQAGNITFQTTKGMLGVDARPLWNSNPVALLSDVTSGGSLPHTIAVDLQTDTITTDAWATILNVTGAFLLNLVEVRSASSISTASIRVYIDGTLVVDISSFSAPASTGDYSRVIGPGGAEILSSLMASTSLRIDAKKFTGVVPNYNVRTQYQEVGF